jgi:protease-4
MSSIPPAPTVIPVMAPAPRGRGCLVALVILLAIGLGVSLLANLALVGAKAGAQAEASRPEPLRQKWVAGSGDARVCLIELSGVIMEEVKSGGLLGATTRPVERIQRELDEAAKDDHVKAVLFSVDSPGGSVSASDGIWHAIKGFKERSKKPVVVWMGGLAASGGYYVSAPADAIFCSPTTITGSIGVIMETFNFSGIEEKFGVQNVTIKAGANKDLLNPFQPIREEHVRVLQGMIDDAYDLFVSRVADGRTAAGLNADAVRQLADGRIYTAKQALELKLVDKIGYRDDAFEDAKKRGGITGDATLFRYTKLPGFLEALAGDAEAAAPAAGALAGLDLGSILSLGTPRLMYLWTPTAR